MERFIRQKYQHRSLEDGRPKPPSRTESDYPRSPPSPEASPPPLPPKGGKGLGFGLRSASSHSHLGRKFTGKSSERSASLGVGTASFASKLTTLRDMGFPDDQRNAVVLKGHNGDIERAVESLVRLGEGSHLGSRSRSPVPPKENTPKREVSNNPFDQLDKPNQPQPSQLVTQSTSQPAQSSQLGHSSQLGQPTQFSQPTTQSYNPFDMPTPYSASAQPQSFESSFQNLQVSQPLFPHSTGGYPTQRSHTHPFPQSATPPVTSTYQGMTASPQAMENYNPFFQPQPNYPTQNPYPTQKSYPPTQNNPFFTSQNTQTLATQQPQPQHANTMPAPSTSPFGPLPPQQALPPQFTGNPFQSMPQNPNTGYQGQFQQSGTQSAPQLTPKPPGMDKNSILALYNFSPPPPAISEQPHQPQTTYQQPPTTQPPPPESGSRNPFFASTPQAQAQPQPQPQQAGFAPLQKSHMSQPSVDVSNRSLQNGRHSPDAFASLSARYG